MNLIKQFVYKKLDISLYLYKIIKNLVTHKNINTICMSLEAIQFLRKDCHKDQWKKETKVEEYMIKTTYIKKSN